MYVCICNTSKLWIDMNRDVCWCDTHEELKDKESKRGTVCVCSFVPKPFWKKEASQVAYIFLRWKIKSLWDAVDLLVIVHSIFSVINVTIWSSIFSYIPGPIPSICVAASAQTARLPSWTELTNLQCFIAERLLKWHKLSHLVGIFLEAKGVHLEGYLFLGFKCDEVVAHRF